MKQITVSEIKYQAEDGEIFDTKEDAIHYELMKSGKRRACPSCKGTTKVWSEDFRYTTTCTTCNGKGYQEKVEEWK